MSDELVPQIITTAIAEPIPAFTGQMPGDLRQAIGRAVDAWLLRTPSPHTRKAYEHDLNGGPAPSLRKPTVRNPFACQSGECGPAGGAEWVGCPETLRKMGLR